MRIAIYSGEIPSTTFIENLIRGLADRSCRVLLFGNKKRSIHYQNDNVKIYATSNHSLIMLLQVIVTKLWFILFRNSEYKKIKKVIRERAVSRFSAIRLWAKYLPVILHKPDIFHVQWAKSLNEWIFLNEDFGVQLVLSLRGAQINYSPIADIQLAASYKVTFPKVSAFHAVSKAIADKAQTYHAESEKIEVIYSGVSASLIQEELDPEKYTGLPKRKLQIISVGRDHWNKGYNYALLAMKHLSDLKIDFYYTIIAPGSCEEILFYIHDLGLVNRVSLYNQSQTHTDIIERIRKADVLLLPSIEEGIANVVLEAMALGTLVISSNCGGMTEVLDHGKNGFIVSIRDPQSISEQVVELIAMDLNKLKEIIDAAKRTIGENHTLSIHAEKMKELYQSVADI